MKTLLTLTLALTCLSMAAQKGIQEDWTTATDRTTLSIPITSHMPIGLSSARVALELPTSENRSLEAMVGMIYMKNDINHEELNTKTLTSPEVRISYFTYRPAKTGHVWMRHGVAAGIQRIVSNESIEYTPADEVNLTQSEYDGCPAPGAVTTPYGDHYHYHGYLREQMRYQAMYVLGRTWYKGNLALMLNGNFGVQFIKTVNSDLDFSDEAGLHLQEHRPDASGFAPVLDLDFRIGLVVKKPQAPSSL